LYYYYKFFGLVLRSNLSLPGIPSETITTERCDVALHLGVSPYAERENIPVSEELIYVSSETNGKGEPALQIWEVKGGAFVRMIYSDGTHFWLDQARENIWATWPNNLPLEDTTPYLLGPVLGLLLRLRGVVCLHASAVRFGGQSIAFLGSVGAGKSTTAAAFARRGHAVLSDDIVALVESEGLFLVMPAYPHLCLWPDSVNALYGSPEALPRFATDWEKRRLALGQAGTCFESRTLPLGAIYILGDRRPDPAPYVESVAPQDALLSLVTETYANKILDRELRAREFALLGQLVTKVPIRRIYANEDTARLEDLCNLIREDFATLETRAPARPGNPVIAAS
jgi:hypothetical protein